MEFTEAHIRELAKGDPKAFCILYENFFIAFCIFARNFGLCKEEAEDIVQEIFLKLYDERSLLNNISTLKSYLYSGVRNRCLNKDKKCRHRNEFLFFENLESDKSHFEKQVLENEVYRELKLLLEELPPQCKNIFERTLNGDTSEQIAQE